MDIQRLLSDRARAIEASGIRRVFELGAKLKDPINLSIGQPDFPVPDEIKRAAIEAIELDRNGYTLTQGIPELRERIERELAHDLGWSFADASDPGVLVTSGTSGALLLAMLALVGPGDEFIIPDPYFVMYPHLAPICAGKAVRCETYPDFRMTAARIEPLITARTKAVLFNSPGNPTGVVASREECRDVLDLCRRRGVFLISDEIYDGFVFEDGATDHAAKSPGDRRCPSPARAPGAGEDVLVIRGFGKTYGVTGWRMGYAAGPRALLAEIAKLQQYTFVCAPSMAQWGCLAAFDADISGHVREYQSRRDMVVERLGAVTDLTAPAGAFYAFPRVPERLGLTATQLVARAVERNLLTIPGHVFSSRDTHLRLSFAAPREKLGRGLEILAELLAGG
ncbi:MAG TPA: aminotransferase class I/II-fold pyridoxal phosphate-dependent enzyme [Phycisphaerales bacterium]|nr:aminotransferase class I/II-fold pyridoxal phosphate-dependent enzyme [Phycisphaerales bacterium]